MRDRQSESVPYQLFMLVLCVLALAALGWEVVADPGPEVRSLLDHADTAVCVLFFIDFCVTLWRAENRMRYLATWGWIDLVSSIPMLDAARWGRIARATRIFRVIRAMRATTLLGRALIEGRAQTGIFAAVLTAILLLLVSSISILQVETVRESNITGAEDALWWALTTITTVGYGDRFPVTTEGRAVAAVLMCAGVGLFGTFSAYLASVFVSPGVREESREIVDLRREIAELRALIVERSGGAGRA